jgi:hypothetical protein
MTRAEMTGAGKDGVRGLAQKYLTALLLEVFHFPSAFPFHHSPAGFLYGSCVLIAVMGSGAFLLFSLSLVNGES